MSGRGGATGRVVGWDSLSENQKVARFRLRFDGSPQSHGRFVLDGKTNKDGKKTGRAETIPGPAGLAHFTAHLKGEQGLGTVPIRPGNFCDRGIIDIDREKEGAPPLPVPSTDAVGWHALFAAEVPELRLVLFLSKSGAVHAHLFAREDVPAALMRRALAKARDRVGLPPNTEI